MKRLLLVLILLIPLVNAISTDMKPTYQPGETLIIKISGNILSPINPSDVEFKRGHVLVPFSYDIKRIRENYYLYAQIPFSENNYTLFLKNIQTTINGNSQTITYNQSFNVSGNITDYSISPGFFITDEDIRISVSSNKDISQEISVDFPESQTIFINPGQSTIKFPILDVSPGFRIINFGSYQIPILILNKSTPIEQTEFKLKFFPEAINSILLLGETKTYPFKIFNDAQKSILNLNFNYNSDIFEITPSIIYEIFPNTSRDFNISIKSQDQNIYDLISISSGDNNSTLIINITYTDNESNTGTPYLEQNFSSQQNYYCEELSGIFCNADQICSADIITSRNGQCCTGACINPGEKSYSWIGWVLGALVIIIIAWLAIKYKKSNSLTKKTNPLSSSLSSKDHDINPLAPIKSLSKK